MVCRDYWLPTWYAACAPQRQLAARRAAVSRFPKQSGVDPSSRSTYSQDQAAYLPMARPVGPLLCAIASVPHPQLAGLSGRVVGVFAKLVALVLCASVPLPVERVPWASYIPVSGGWGARGDATAPQNRCTYRICSLHYIVRPSPK